MILALGGVGGGTPEKLCSLTKIKAFYIQKSYLYLMENTVYIN